MQVDGLEMVVGPPRYGKSTLAWKRVNAYLRAGYWVFAHDEKHQYRDCAYYRTPGEWQAVYDDAERRQVPMRTGASFGCSVEEVVELALAAGEAVGNRHDRVRVPILLALDEASASDMTANYLPPIYKKLLSRRAHFGVAALMLVQWSTQIHKAVMATATDVFLFCQSVEEQRFIEPRCHLERGALAGLEHLPKYQYIRIRRGEGIVADVDQPTAAPVRGQSEAAPMPAPAVPPAPGGAAPPPGSAAPHPAPTR